MSREPVIRIMCCKKRLLPKTVEPGDIVVVSEAGAYGYAMTYEYNGRVKPAEVLIENGKPRLIRKRGSFEDMIGNMILPGKEIQK